MWMQGKPSLSAVLVLVVLLLFQGLAPDLQAQMPPAPSPQQLDQLLAPVALYPDALLAQITTASTNPQEILDVDNWLAQNQNLSESQLTAAAQQQGFDPAFIALVGFPQVLQMMAENIDDYAAIGSAVSGNQAEVSASIQRLRSQAYASGALRSTPQQVVDVQQGYYAIQPANPQVVYLPQYDPTVVYAGSGAGALTFGIAIGITALMVSQPWGWGGWGWNWGGRSIYYNRAPWGGWRGGYRPPLVTYRPRPIAWGGRPGYGGNWGYRPPNYRPPQPINRPGNRPGYNRPVNGPGYRPPSNNRPPNFSRPPGNNRPPNGGQPSIQPVRPGGPGGPGNGPQPRPTTSRPPTSQMQRPVGQQNRPPGGGGGQQGRPPGGGGGQPNRPPGGGGGQQGRPSGGGGGQQTRPAPQSRQGGNDGGRPR
jgi:hypothetical protein